MDAFRESVRNANHRRQVQYDTRLLQPGRLYDIVHAERITTTYGERIRITVSNDSDGLEYTYIALHLGSEFLSVFTPDLMKSIEENPGYFQLLWLSPIGRRYHYQIGTRESFEQENK